jgi:hypothetical protein
MPLLIGSLDPTALDITTRVKWQMDKSNYIEAHYNPKTRLLEVRVMDGRLKALADTSNTMSIGVEKR